MRARACGLGDNHRAIIQVSLCRMGNRAAGCVPADRIGLRYLSTMQPIRILSAPANPQRSVPGARGPSLRGVLLPGPISPETHGLLDVRGYDAATSATSGAASGRSRSPRYCANALAQSNVFAGIFPKELSIAHYQDDELALPDFHRARAHRVARRVLLRMDIGSTRIHIACRRVFIPRGCGWWMIRRRRLGAIGPVGLQAHRGGLCRISRHKSRGNPRKGKPGFPGKYRHI